MAAHHPVVGKIRNLAEEASMVFPNSQIYVVALAGSQRRGNIQNVINRVNAILKNAAKLSNFIFIGNVDVSLRRDGIHPNSDGVKALSSAFAAYFQNGHAEKSSHRQEVANNITVRVTIR